MKATQHNLQSDTIETINIEKYYGTERTEEVRDIIERMPTKFGFIISIVIGFIFLLMLIFGWIVRYPDLVSGHTTINTSVAPIKLVANSAGKLHLNKVQSLSAVKKGQIIAYLETAASFDTLQFIKQLLKSYNPNDVTSTAILSKLPSTPALGELTSKYYTFISSLHQLATFNDDRLYDKQIASLHSLHGFQLKEVTNSRERTSLSEGVVSYSKQSLKRDSILFSQKVISAAEFEQAKVEYLSRNSGFTNAKTSQIDAEEKAHQTQGNITQTQLQKNEKLKDIKISILSSYNDLMDNIELWEDRYLFKSPFDGQIQFLKFWTNSQFVQVGEPVFTIVPQAEEPYGQIILPAVGAGKVKEGQEVIIKLNDFPYTEYGSITGIVSAISLTTNTEKTEQGTVEAYLITVKFPKGLISNYGKPLAFKHEAKGTAEIITKDRRLIERLFDNLQYAISK